MKKITNFTLFIILIQKNEKNKIQKKKFTHLKKKNEKFKKKKYIKKKQTNKKIQENWRLLNIIKEFTNIVILFFKTLRLVLQ